MSIINKNLILDSDKQFKSKQELFELIAKTIQKENDGLDSASVVAALEQREAEGTTGIGDGMAIPHASIGIKSPQLVIIRLSKKLDWNSIDSKKVDLIVAILVPDNESGRAEHFKLLTNFSRSMVDPSFKEALKTGTKDQIIKAIDGIGKEEKETKTEVKEGVMNIVAITSCATGIAHTYMAAEAIENGAAARGYNVKVEKRGGMGAENPLTREDIENADVCIIASEVNIDPSLFEGKRLFVTQASEAIKLGDKYIDKAVKQALIYKGKGLQKTGPNDETTFSFADNSTTWKRVQKHMLFGVSWMLPLVVVSGITLGMVNVITSIAFEPGADWALWDGNVFMQPMIIFGQIGFGAMFAVFSAGVAYSMAGKPAAMPAFIAGMMIVNPDLIFIGYNWEFLDPIRDAGITGGFFGAIFTGLFVGWAVGRLSEIKVHPYAAALMPVLIIPLFLSFFMFLIIKFVVGLPLALIMYVVFVALEAIADAGPAFVWIVGGIFGALCMVDLGGPINKTAFAVSVALFIDPAGGFTEIWQPYAAFHMAIPVASIGALLACSIRPKLFNERQKVEASTAAAMGTFGISEGSIPIAISNPKVWMPANIIGGFVAGSLIVLCGVKVYGGVAGPLMMVLGSMESAYGAYWTVFILWPLVTFIGAMTTALIAILLISLENKKVAKLEAEQKVEATKKFEAKNKKVQTNFSREKAFAGTKINHEKTMAFNNAQGVMNLS